MHDYEALHYDKEQLKEACEWQQDWAGVSSCWAACRHAAGTCSQLLKGPSVFQLCLWALWWSLGTATWSSVVPTLRDSSR